MLVLLDECLPRPLKRVLLGHSVKTVAEMGWSGRRNGALLRLLDAAGFQAFITMDRGIPHQQKLASKVFGTIILSAFSNQLPDLAPLAPEIEAALSSLKPGDCIRVGRR
jgi:hypothetical protein